MSPDQNRASANLLLLCRNHHAEVDDPRLVEKYPAELLREWKSQQETTDGASRGFALTDDEVREIVATSFDVIADTISLGGQGGAAPGAGGGGGGAIGPGARGGDGGGGGEIVSITGPASSLPEALNIEIGEPGQGGKDDGDGEPGGDTRIGDFLVARAGSAGRGRSVVEKGAVPVSGLTVAAAFLADVIQCHDGVMNALSAGWRFIEVDEVPFRIQLCVGTIIDLANQALRSGHDMEIALQAPGGRIAARQLFRVNPEDGVALSRQLHSHTLGADIPVVGTWIVHVNDISGSRAEVPFEVIVRSESDASAPGQSPE